MVIGERPPSPARLAHTSEKHPRGTLTELNVLRRHRELCDVVLNVGSRKIFAHRYVYNFLIYPIALSLISMLVPFALRSMLAHANECRS